LILILEKEREEEEKFS